MRYPMGFLLVLLTAALFQNCGKPQDFAANDLSSLEGGSSSSSSSSSSNKVVSLYENSSTLQETCTKSNRLVLLMDSSVYSRGTCRDFSELIPNVKLGTTCQSGIVVSDFDVSQEAKSCSALTLCGKAPSVVTREASGKLKMTFNNLPWGCRVNLSIFDSAADDASSIANFSADIKVPACRWCSSSNSYTCGSCADPQCLSPSNTPYSIGQYRTEACPTGYSGSGPTYVCQTGGVWGITQGGTCAAPAPTPTPQQSVTCSYSGQSYSVGESRSGSCNSGETGQVQFTCESSGSWKESRSCVAAATPTPSPTPQATPANYKVVVGRVHTCINKGGALLCAGNNAYGQIAAATATGNATFTGVSGFESNVESIAAGAHHTCAVSKTSGKKQLYCWGSNSVSQLGLGKVGGNYTAPQAVSGMDNVSAVSSFGGFTTNTDGTIAANLSTTCAINNGAVYCWGRNSEGQAGPGDAKYVTLNSPTAAIDLSSGVTDISVGYTHTCAIKGGALYCWGDNTYSQLGQILPLVGKTQPVKTDKPTAVPGMSSGVTSVAAGIHSTCAVQNSVLKCWGYAANGRLGLGTPDTKVTNPTTVGIFTDAKKIFSGWGNFFMVRSDSNSAYYWGYSDTYYQLGNKATVSVTAPAAHADLKQGVEAVAGSRYHGCAFVKNSSSQMELYCWGLNSSKQLGLPAISGNIYSTPAKVNF